MGYIAKYRPGKLNGVPDALSRYPFLGPKQLTRVGSQNAVSFLMDSLPESCKVGGHPLWFWAASDTDTLVKSVRDWRGRGRSGAVITRAPKSAVRDKSWMFGIVIPRSDQATEICRLVYHTKRPVCVLLPSDLVHLVSQNTDGTYDG